MISEYNVRKASHGSQRYIYITFRVGPWSVALGVSWQAQCHGGCAGALFVSVAELKKQIKKSSTLFYKHNKSKGTTYNSIYETYTTDIGINSTREIQFYEKCA